MPTVIVSVMPKKEILDPQGKAISGAIARQGIELGGVRVGKRFEIEVAKADEATLASIRGIAEDLLANTVIEDVVSIDVVDDAEGR